MIKQLLLMRHAKSSWKDDTLSDHARPLNGRGRGDAPRMARQLTRHELTPTLIISSDARRTQQTASLMLSWWSDHGVPLPELRWSSALYEASGDQILTVLEQHLEQPARLLLLGHNPGMEEALASLTGQRLELTTGNIAALERQDVDEPWQLQALWRPREL